jgi:hypothetical protein
LHTLQIRQTGKPGSRKDNREEHCTPGNDPNGVPWKNLLRRYSPIRREILFCFLELAKGIEPPTL